MACSFRAFPKRELCSSHDPATQLLERITVNVFIKLKPKSETAMAHQTCLLEADQPPVCNLGTGLSVYLTDFRGVAPTVAGRSFGT